MNKKQKTALAIIIALFIIGILIYQQNILPLALGGYTTLSLDKVEISGQDRIRIYGTATGAEEIRIQFSESQLDSYLNPQGLDATKPVSGIIRLEEQKVKFPITKRGDEVFYNVNILDRGRLSICSLERCQEDLNEINPNLKAKLATRTPTLICKCLYAEQEGINAVFTGSKSVDYRVYIEINGQSTYLTRDTSTVTLANGKAQIENIGGLNNFDQVGTPSSYSLLFKNSQYEKFLSGTAYSSYKTNINSLADCLDISAGSFGISFNPISYLLNLPSEKALENCVNSYRNSLNSILGDKTSIYKNSISYYTDDISFVGDNLVIDLKVPSQFPTFIIDLDASWVGIEELKGEPEIISCPSDKTVKSGDTLSQTISVRNKGTQDGSFYGTVSCTTPPDVSGVISETFFDSGQTKDMQISLSASNTGGGIKYSVCTYRVMDRKSGKYDTCSSKIGVEYQSGIVCTPGTFSCEGNNLMMCSSDGSGKELYKACESGCQNNACVGEPTPDSELYCSDCNDFAVSKLIGYLWKEKKCIPKWNHTYTLCLFSFLRILLVPIAFILILFFSADFLESFNILRGEKKKILRILISIIIAAILSYILYISFFIGLVIIVIYLVIKFVVGKYL